MPVVFVPGKGNIQFPDNMTPYQINLIIEREILPGKKPETISAPKPPEASLTNILKGVGENFRLGLENVREAVSEITPGEYIESGLVNAGRILAAPRIIQNKMFEAAGITPKAPPPPPRQGPRISERIDEAIGLGSPQERARRAAEEARRAQIYGAAAVRSPGEQRRLSQQAEAAAAKPEFESILGEGLYSGATSLAQMTPGIAASLLTRNPTAALASAGALSASDQYYNVLDRGGTRQEALDAAQLTGATEVATELLPMGAVVNSLGKVGVLKFLREYLGKDLPTELLATVAQNAIDTAIANPDKTWADYFSELPKDLAVTAVSTIVPGAALATAGKGLEIAARRSGQLPAEAAEAPSAAGLPPAPPPPPPPADFARRLGPVGGTVSIQEPSGVRAYRFDGFDEDGNVLLTDEDGLTYADDPAEVAQMMVGEKAPAAKPEAGAPPAASFGMDITEGLPAPTATEAEQIQSMNDEVSALRDTIRESDEALAELYPQVEETGDPELKAKYDRLSAQTESLKDRLGKITEALPAPAAEAYDPYRITIPDVKEPITFPETQEELDQFRANIEPTLPPRESMTYQGRLDRLYVYKSPKGRYRLPFFVEGTKVEPGIAAPESVAAPAAPEESIAPPETKTLPVDKEVASYMDEYARFRTAEQMDRIMSIASDIARSEGKRSISRDALFKAGMQFDDELAAQGRPSPAPAPAAAPAAPAAAEDVLSGLQRIMGRFHPQLREMFMLPQIQEKIASGQPLTADDIPDALKRNITPADRILVARALTENPQQVVDAANSVPFTTPAGDVVYPAAATAEAAPAAAPAPESVRTVTTPGGGKVDVAFEVVEAADLQAATGQLQNRQRTRASTDIQVQDIISKFDPQRLGESLESDRGSPIIGPDNVVESGNGRVMALNRIYEAYPEKAEEYRKFIEAQGFDVSGMERPILVRRRITDMTMDERAQFVRESNMDTKLALSTSERAGTDAASLTPDVMALMAVPDVSAAANRDFVRAFLSKLPPQEQGGFFDKGGNLSAEGIRRLRTAVKASAYGDVDLINTLEEAQDNNIKSIGGALEDVAAPWRRLRDAIAEGDVVEEMEVTPQLVEAAKIVRDVRNQGMKIGDFLAQQDAFNPLDPVTERFIRLFYNEGLGRAAGREAITDGLAKYARRAAEQSTGDALFAQEPMSPSDILDGILNERGVGEGGLLAAMEKPAPSKKKKRAEEIDKDIGKAATQQDEIVEQAAAIPSLSRKVRKYRRQYESGKITAQEYADIVSEWSYYIDDLKQQQQWNKLVTPRARGADFIRQKLLEAKRRGDIPQEALDFAEWYIMRNPALVDDLGISMRRPSEGSGAGDYNRVSRVMRLFKGATNDTTPVHEILHHTERMMPADLQEAIRASWKKSFQAAAKKAEPRPTKLFFEALEGFHSKKDFKIDDQTFPWNQGMDTALNLLRQGWVPMSNYQFVTPSEFWAVNATDIMKGRYDVKGSLLGRLRNWLSGLAEKAKDLFGLPSNAPIIRALDSLAKSDGVFVSKSMLQKKAVMFGDEKVVAIAAKRHAEIMEVARAVAKDPKAANLRQIEGIIDLLDEVYASPDEVLSNEAARIQDQLMDLEDRIRASKTPLNDNVLETELQKAEREYDKIRDEYNKFFYNPDDERMFADGRSREFKAWRKESDALEAKLQEAGKRFEELYRQETDRLYGEIKHGSADEMKKAVATGQKPDDKIMQERSDLQNKNRGCD